MFLTAYFLKYFVFLFGWSCVELASAHHNFSTISLFCRVASRCFHSLKITRLFRFCIANWYKKQKKEEKAKKKNIMKSRNNVDLHIFTHSMLVSFDWIFIWDANVSERERRAQTEWEKDSWALWESRAHSKNPKKMKENQIHNEPKLALHLNVPQMTATQEHRPERSHNSKWKININYVIICFVPRERRKENRIYARPKVKKKSCLRQRLICVLDKTM